MPTKAKTTKTKTKAKTTAAAKTKETKRSAKTILKKVKKAVKPKATSAKKTTAKKGKVSPEELYRRTEQKAYEIFQQRGFAHGSDGFDWSIAEQIVRLETQNGAKKRKKSVSEDQLRQKTEQKAYELFERKGYAHGSDYSDWLLARQLVELENS